MCPSADADYEKIKQAEDPRENEEESSSIFSGGCERVEQEQGHLLGDSGDDERLFLPRTSDCGSLQDLPSSSARSRWRRVVGPASFVGLAAILSLIVVVFILADWSTRGPLLRAAGGKNESKSSNPEYVLASDWDAKAAPTRREYHWVIRATEWNPDGIYKPMVMINGQFPGPLIEANAGDNIVVHVNNQAENATSIHWHGLYQNGTNSMDGTVGITQCPIAPGMNFTYQFNIGQQSGTYWYHAHHGAQTSDGIVGPIVIHDKKEREAQKLPYTTDRVVMVSDHYWDTSSALLMRYLATDGENTEPVPEGALINGRAVRDCSQVPPHRRCDNRSTHVGIPRIHLEANQFHRLRIINVGAFAEFQLQIDEHEFAVTEVDGTAIIPAYYHRLKISPGQRYSIVINANMTSSDMFWLRARMITGCFAENNPDLDPEVRAIIHYSPSDSNGTAPTTLQVPTSRDWPEIIEVVCRDMNTTELIPVEVTAAPAKADAFFYLRSNFEIGAWRLSRGFFNQSSWRPDVQSPTLMRAIDGLKTQNESFTASAAGSADRSAAAFINDAAFDTSKELVIQTNGIQVIDVLVTNFDDGNHPMHLHGYKNFVLAQGHGYPPTDLLSTIDLSNPLRRDSASVEAFGWLLLRFVADNPGAWAFHCHISWHTEAGLLMQFLTRTDLLALQDLPESNKLLCASPVEQLRKGATPSDEVFFGNV